MNQRLDDAEYKLELAQARAKRAEDELHGMTVRYHEAKEKLGTANLTVKILGDAHGELLMERDLWRFMDLTAAADHTTKAAIFVDWYDKTGLIGTRHSKDALQGGFSKPVRQDVDDK